MGRRSLHKAEELKELFISTALAVIEKEGVSGISARLLARQVGYSPGTLYNVFQNLDALIFHVEERMLDDLCSRLMEAQNTASPETRLHSVAQAYLDFAEDRPRAWSLLFEHHVQSASRVPAAYTERLKLVVKVIEHAIGSGRVEDTSEPGHTLGWLVFCSLNWIAAMATSAKFAGCGAGFSRQLVERLVADLQRHADVNWSSATDENTPGKPS